MAAKTAIPIPQGATNRASPYVDWTIVSEGCYRHHAAEPAAVGGRGVQLLRASAAPPADHPAPAAGERAHRPAGHLLHRLPHDADLHGDIRGFTVVIEATAEQFTWHTGDATGLIVTPDPGAPYPGQTIEHSYRSGHLHRVPDRHLGRHVHVNGSARPTSPARRPPTARRSPSTSSRPGRSSPTPTTDHAPCRMIIARWWSSRQP